MLPVLGPKQRQIIVAVFAHGNQDQQGDNGHEKPAPKPYKASPDKISRKSPLQKGIVGRILQHGRDQHLQEPDYHEERIQEIMRRVALGLPTDCGPLPGDRFRSAENDRPM